MPRSLADILRSADTYADRAECYEPGSEDETTTPEMLVRRAAWKRDQAERELAAAIAAARREEVTWHVIGDTIGTSPQAAQRRYRNVVVTDRSGRRMVRATTSDGRIVKPDRPRPA